MRRTENTCRAHFIFLNSTISADVLLRGSGLYGKMDFDVAPSPPQPRLLQYKCALYCWWTKPFGKSMCVAFHLKLENILFGVPYCLAIICHKDNHEHS